MRRIHSPVLLANVEDARARSFVVLFTSDAIARSLLISLVPLQAYALLGAAQLVSVVYFLVAFVGLAASLTVPVVLHRVRRRWVLTTGAIAQVLSSLLFAMGTTASIVAGLALQMLAMAILDVVINLYLLDHIPRRGLNHFEPRRLLFAGSAFAAGPWLGVYLHGNAGENLPYLVAATASLTLLTFFWTLRLADNPSLQAATHTPPRPLRFVLRFAASRRAPRCRRAGFDRAPNTEHDRDRGRRTRNGACAMDFAAKRVESDAGVDLRAKAPVHLLLGLRGRDEDRRERRNHDEQHAERGEELDQREPSLVTRMYARKATSPGHVTLPRCAGWARRPEA